MSPTTTIAETITPPRRAAAEGPSIAVLYENWEWTRPLLEALDQGGLNYDAINVADAAFMLDDPGDYPVVVNRVSPSAELRDNGSAIGLARGWLETLDRAGARVINGAESFRHETSKVAQYQLIRGLGLTVPRTAVFNDRNAIRRLARGFPFPAILKPDTGGSGAGVRFVGSRRELERLLDDAPELFESDQVLLLQEFIASPDGSIVRTEFVDGEFMYAMRVRPTNTFNLCPADGCDRPPIEQGVETAVAFEHEPDIPAEAVSEARTIVRAAGLAFGGVEYLEGHDGRRYYYDINATSVYRADMQAAAGTDAMATLVSLIEREAAQARAAALAAA